MKTIQHMHDELVETVRQQGAEIKALRAFIVEGALDAGLGEALRRTVRMMPREGGGFSPVTTPEEQHEYEAMGKAMEEQRARAGSPHNLPAAWRETAAEGTPTDAPASSLEGDDGNGPPTSLG